MTKWIKLVYNAFSMKLIIPPLSQRDTRWASQRLGTVNGITIGSHGCVITCMSMISIYYGHQITPNQLDDILTNRNLYYDGDLFVNGSITKIFANIKFDKVVFCETSPAPIGDIKSYLEAGKPVVVALINQGIRHYVLAVGVEGDRIFVNDPWMGDSVAINDRWGEPKFKILQVNFFSGPVPKITQPVESCKPIDPGGDDRGHGFEAPVQPVIDPPVVEVTPTTITVTPSVPVVVEQKKPSFLESLKSRKFILASISSATAFLNAQFGWGVTNDQLMLILLPILAFIIGEAIADAIERARKPI